MDRLKDSDSRFKGLEIKIGLLVLIVLVGIAFVVISLGIERGIFTKKYTLYFITESGEGFREGMPVKLSGFNIGRVKNIELAEDARVTVYLEINNKYRGWLRSGSVARVIKEGFIGDAVVEVTVGKPGTKEYAEGEMIPFEKAGGMAEIVNEVKPVLNEIKEIIHYINDPAGDIKKTLSNVQNVTAGMLTTREKVDSLLDQTGTTVKKVQGLVDTVAENTGPAMESTARIIKNMEQISLKLIPTMERIDRIAGNAEMATQRLPAITDKLERTIDNVKGMSDALSNDAPRIGEILMDAGDAARDGKALVKGVRESWPGRLVAPKPRSPELVPFDGSLMNVERR